MSRHSKNNTAHSFFTYYEKKKVKDSGTLTSRVESESLRRFEDCWLCLSIAKNPVCTLSGCIYCRNCLMDNLAVQRQNNEYRYQQWEKEHLRAFQLMKEKEKFDHQEEVQKFIEANKVIKDQFSIDQEEALQSSLCNDKKRLRTDKAESRSASFWIAENTPDPYKDIPVCNPQTAVESNAPSKHFHCPVSKKRLRIKDIVNLKPLTQPQISTHLNEERQGSWICAVTKKQIGFKQAVALKPTGQIVLEECFKEKLLDGFIPQHPKITEVDIIRLIPGGTSFSAHNKVEVKIVRPVME